MVILHQGKILAEQYWEVKGARSAKYRQRIIGQSKQGQAIEDVASAQKSVVSVLVGIAQEKGLLNIADRVGRHLGTGWSKATPKQENDITIRHLITMSSGLTERGTFEAQAGTKWRYNTWAYAQTVSVLEKAAGMDRHELTRQWLTDPLGMPDSKWVRRGSPELQAINGFGFATSARDLARFGLMVLADGGWNGKTILGDQAYLRDATRTSQKLNPNYGYLWWTGTSESDRGDSAFSGEGIHGQFLYINPALNIVIVVWSARPQPSGGAAIDEWAFFGAVSEALRAR